MDHIVPRSKGGTDDSENLQAACMACNRGKAARAIEGVDTERDFGVHQIHALTMVASVLVDAVWEVMTAWQHGWPLERKMMEEMGSLSLEMWDMMAEHGALPENHPFREMLEYRRWQRLQERGG